MKDLKKILGQTAHWNLNKDLVRKLGLTETLVLQQIIDLNYIFKKTEIFQSIGDMSIELGIAEYSVKTAIKKLKDLGFINVERKSIGYRNFYSINEEKIKELMNEESFEEFLEIQKQTDNTNTTLNLRLGPIDVTFNSELKNDMGELKSTDSSTNTNISEVNTIVGELKTIPQRVENNITITNNTTNNKLIKNTIKNTNVADKNIADKKLTKIIELMSSDYSLARKLLIELEEDYNGLDNCLDIAYPNDTSAQSKWKTYLFNLKIN